jgi:hypothetical protein
VETANPILPYATPAFDKLDRLPHKLMLKAAIGSWIVAFATMDLACFAWWLDRYRVDALGLLPSAVLGCIPFFGYLMLIQRVVDRRCHRTGSRLLQMMLLVFNHSIAFDTVVILLEGKSHFMPFH